MTGLIHEPMLVPTAVPVSDPVVELLKEARERVSQGWTRGVWQDCGKQGQIRYCMLGAILSLHCTDQDAFKNATLVLGESVPGFDITGWNDSQKSVWPVLAKFDEAIKLREEKIRGY